MPVDLAKILATRGGLTELRDLLVDEIVDRLEIVGLPGGVPGLEAQDVVAGSCLCLRRAGKGELVAVGGDQIKGEIDLLLVRPFAAELLQDLARTGDPMVPKAHAQLAGRMGATHERSSKCGGSQRRGLEHRAP